VLVVDDEEDVADALAVQIGDAYDTRVAYGGREALERFDSTVDAVLLDRRMPDVHGDDVLAAIREGDADPVVVMTTAVDPDINILEMDFDDYLVKPVDTETLREALDRHLETTAGGDPQLSELFSVVSKIDVLEAELSPAELADSEEYDDLLRRLERLRRELADSHPDLPELVATYRDIDRES
jgi:DNA-binding response OmpR family regulator